MKMMRILIILMVDNHYGLLILDVKNELCFGREGVKSLHRWSLKDNQGKYNEGYRSGED